MCERERESVLCVYACKCACVVLHDRVHTLDCVCEGGVHSVFVFVCVCVCVYMCVCILDN